jgi:endogenous inhibitor of DNA gyrase (YacG/DUF329 family)
MNFSTPCPSCGAAVEIAEQAEQVVCPFCGTQFELDFSNARPELRPTPPRAADPDVIVPDPNDIFTPPSPGGQPASPYSRPQEDPFAPLPGQEAFDLPYLKQAVQKLVSPRAWIWLGTAVVVIFCISCLCMLALVRLLFGSS